eukprot:SM000041S15458  [mRNA]  locus=s41:269498:272769:+ [translate_table: standard]
MAPPGALPSAAGDVLVPVSAQLGIDAKASHNGAVVVTVAAPGGIPLESPPPQLPATTVVDLGAESEVPIGDLLNPLLHSKRPGGGTGGGNWACPRVPTSWPGVLGKDESHVSKVFVALAIGAACSLVACFFYAALSISLSTFWSHIPARFIEPLAAGRLWVKFTYLLTVTTGMGLLVGCCLRYIGFPGDLPFMVYCVHHTQYVPLKHFGPMLACSLASIVGGGSLGPEAPIVLMCACTAGALGRALGHTGRMLRQSTLCGMACGFASFFGVPLGGSLFALEVLHRMGLEFYESATYAVFSGTASCILYHYIMGLPLGGIWEFGGAALGRPTLHNLMLGFFLGAVGACAAFVFLKIHALVGHAFEAMRLKKHQLVLSTAAGLLLGGLGILIPQTLFWGEYEIASIVTRGKSPLPHIYPRHQLLPYSLESSWANLMVAVAKLTAISITLHGGFRGGFIFPFFLAGSAIGSGLQACFPNESMVLLSMCVACSLDVAITRTPFASSLILAALSGEEKVMQPAVAAALMSLMLTNASTFQLIKPQRPRPSVDEGLLDVPAAEYDPALFGE